MDIIFFPFLSNKREKLNKNKTKTKKLKFSSSQFNNLLSPLFDIYIFSFFFYFSLFNIYIFEEQFIFIPTSAVIVGWYLAHNGALDRFFPNKRGRSYAASTSNLTG